jgi:molecular chaperone GrpE
MVTDESRPNEVGKKIMFRFNDWPGHTRPNAPEQFGLPRIYPPVTPLRRAEVAPQARFEAPEEPDDVAEVPAPQAKPEAVAAAPVDREALRKVLTDLTLAQARVERDAQRVNDETRAKLIRKLLPVLDNLDRTLAASASEGKSTLAEGVRMVRSQLEEVLVDYGVERIPSSGEPFDPAVHEAIATVSVASGQAGLVVQEVEAGYRFAGKLLRAAKVVVGARPS